MVTTVHNCVQCSHSIQQYNTYKHSSTMLSVCLCNRATICCLYKHFARYNTLRHTHILRSWFWILTHIEQRQQQQQYRFKMYTVLWHSQSMTCCYVCAWRHCVELNWIVGIFAVLSSSVSILLPYISIFVCRIAYAYSFQQWTIVTECSAFMGSLGKWFLYMHWTNFGFSFSEYWRAHA